MTRLFATTAAAALMWVASSSCFAEDAVGNWTGAIDGHLISLVHIERTASGGLTGTFASHEGPLTAPDLHALKSTILNIVASDDHLAFTVPGNSGIFDGRWDDGKKAWAGTFQWGEGGYKSTLALSRTDMQSLPGAPTPVTYASAAAESQALDGLVQAYADDGRFMGSVLVTQNGKILLDKGYGFADIARGVPNTPQTAFRIGSITKQFTAACILLLQERGRLRIDDPIKTYLPDAPASWDHVTVRHLLTHTSGLGDYLTDLERKAAEDRSSPLQSISHAQLLALISEEAPQFEPGSQLKYSNSGYALLGLIIEKVSGQAYGDFLHDNIFVPAHMTASAFNPPHAPNQATGYAPSLAGPVPPRFARPDAFADGGIVSTTGDLAKWQKAMVEGKLLSPASLRLMITPVRDGYGMGVTVAAPFGTVDIRHGGRVPGFRADAQYEPADRLAIIIFGNLDRESVNKLGDGLLAVAHGLPGILPPKPYTVASDVLASYVGTYVLTPQLSVVIDYQDGQLTAQGAGLPKVILYGQSDTVFYAKQVDDLTLEFVKAPDGSISIVLHEKGSPDIPGRRK